ncbi:aspartate aminotransferase family protein [Amycolatopsis sp. A133]|uniref:aspartate aminotransferase family protein n=1 Tax=Amycolatopsis sp. A133 TaxID=3064472 RepID=UPI0027FBCA97|nr:aspartate aminotransferase family protein [Amycolatopsis sp. A133]MDQ7803462.1 aspartate aminotransferase family protein [Amycolatopsis sp. A133]
MREAATAVARAGLPRVADAERDYARRTPGSRARWERATRVQPNGVSGNGKYFPPHPLFIADAKGSRVTDVDGHEYLDVLMGSGSLLLGHGHPRIVAAVSEQVARFSGTTMPHEPGLALAERMSAKRGLARIRFTVTGSEATQSALRVARSATGRTRFAKCEGGYHGSGDAFLVATHSTAMAGPDSEPAAKPDYAGLPPSVGDDVIVLPYNDVAAAERLIRRSAADLAAVIVEPVLFSSGGAVPATGEFLDTLRRETAAAGIVLIFDEVVTGYRLGPRGAESHYGVTADLVTLGKGVAGGLPLAAFGGRADLMDLALAGSAESRVFQSGTYVENAVSVAAAHAVLDELAERPDALTRLDALGERLRTGIAAELDRAGVPGVVTGAGSMLHFHLGATSVTNRRELLRADVESSRLAQLALVAAGVLWQPLHPAALSIVHTAQDVDNVLATMREVLR